MTVMEIASRILEIRGTLGLPTTTTMTASGNGGAAFASTLQSTLDLTTGNDVLGNGVTGDTVVADAEKYLGVPYAFGGTNPAVGLDCSALVQRAYADLGVKLPRLAQDQAKQGIAVPSLAAAKPGDLLAFNSPVSHIGIYIGAGKMIVAPHTGDRVKIEPVYTTPSTIRRILPDTTISPSTGPLLRPTSLTSGVPYAGLFQAAGAKYGVSPTLLAAVAKVESDYNPTAVSRAGAQGLMQLMPSTAASLGVNAFDPAQAVDGAARILAQNLSDFGSLPLAIAAYNAGGGAVRKYHGIPPYTETQSYVPKVAAAMTALAGRGFA
jgi:soluble lytic murein transglycosylase-like protein